MRRVIFLEDFTIGTQKFRFTVTDKYTVAFSCVGGHKMKIYDPMGWFKNCETYEDTGSVSNPVAVFRKVGELLLGYIEENNPPLVKFSASTDRKKSLYNRLAKKLDSELPNYEFSYIDDEYVFTKI